MDERRLTWGLFAKDNATGVITGVEKATDKLKETAVGTQKSFAAMNKDLGKVGKGMTKAITLPLAGVATAGLKTVSSFDDSMSGVQAKTKATGTELKQMRDLAKELGSDTAHSAKQNWSTVEKSAA